jgi:energy-coupling factor transporter ATP-binding protein EcfA2
LTDQSKLSLRSLTIHRYEQFLNCPRIEFSSDDNLILGINGSGKTSLLRLLAAVLRWNYDAILGQPFDVEFEQVLEVEPDRVVSIIGRVQFQQPAPDRRGARSTYEGFSARLDIQQSDGAFEIDVRDSLLHVQVKDLLEDRKLVKKWRAKGLPADLRTEGTPVARWLAILASLEISGLGMWDLDERTVGTFVIHETDVDFTRLTEQLPYDYEIEGKYDEQGNSTGRFPGESEFRQWYPLLDNVLAAAEQLQNSQTYLPPVTYRRDSDPERMLDMNSVLTALDAETIGFRLKIEQTQSIGERTLFEGKGVEIRVRFASGTEVIDSRLTFGQKRLITIALGALLCGGSPLLVDEIDNGLHPGLVEKVLGLIRGRQTFIASHNKLVVDLLDYESPEDICRTIHICRRNQDGTQTLVALSDDQVREVFEKIEVRLMNPSDVLQREGLW